MSHQLPGAGRFDVVCHIDQHSRVTQLGAQMGAILAGQVTNLTTDGARAKVAVVEVSLRVVTVRGDSEMNKYNSKKQVKCLGFKLF